MLFPHGNRRLNACLSLGFGGWDFLGLPAGNSLAGLNVPSFQPQYLCWTFLHASSNDDDNNNNNNNNNVYSSGKEQLSLLFSILISLCQE